MKHTKQQFDRAVSFAMPLVRRDEDSQRIQHEMLNFFDFVTDSDEDYEWTLDVIRACEDRIADEEERESWRR